MSEKNARIKDKVTIVQQETISNIFHTLIFIFIWIFSYSNGTMFGDLDWPLNASRGFVSISWASCLTYCWTLLNQVLHEWPCECFSFDNLDCSGMFASANWGLLKCNPVGRARTSLNTCFCYRSCWKFRSLTSPYTRRRCAKQSQKTNMIALLWNLTTRSEPVTQIYLFIHSFITATKEVMFSPPLIYSLFACKQDYA